MMAPVRLQDPADDDPITATYDVFLTPQLASQILLLQYPNRARTRPYNDRHQSAPSNLRIKPQTGHLEMDVTLSTNNNFNKFKSLQWGDAMSTAQEVQNATGTYGPAAGFAGAKPRGGAAGRVVLKDQSDRLTSITNSLADFQAADAEGKAMRRQTLGGQILKQGSEDEAGKPNYFVGAFRNKELHLTKVDGTVQMRPQFHHLDAEEQRARIAHSRAAALEGEARPPAEARSLLAKEKRQDDSEKPRLEDVMRKQLHAAEAEEWVGLQYVDEDMEQAYETFRERMFVRDVEGARRLRSGMDGWDYLDAVSAPKGGRRRRRKRGVREEVELEDDEDDAGEGEDGQGGETMAEAAQEDGG